MVFTDAGNKLSDITKDKKKYKKVLEGLIEEGAFALMEPTVVVRAKESDISLVKEVSADAAKYFEEKSGKPITIEIDEKSFLPSNM